nr:hypothetical protein [Pandoravirus belohorizontensis]
MRVAWSRLFVSPFFSGCFDRTPASGCAHGRPADSLSADEMVPAEPLRQASTGGHGKSGPSAASLPRRSWCTRMRRTDCNNDISDKAYGPLHPNQTQSGRPAARPGWAGP